MKNIYLDHRTANDIDQRIDRVHRDLNYSEGKIELAEVRDVLRLDLKYYKLNDPSLLDEVVHKVKVGARQIIERPTLLIEAARKFDLSALFLPDQKRIFIDAEVPDKKQRWYESHEIAHSLIPWHGDYMLGDDRSTLSQACHQEIEAEANYGAGRLLFPPATFSEAVLASEPSLLGVRQLATAFGNTITSTLWRYVENNEGVMFAAIGEHPRHPEGKPQIEYFVRSRIFEQRYPEITDVDVFIWIKTYCGYNKGGPLGNSEIIITDANGVPHKFLIESFSNGHNTLTLARQLGVASPQLTVPGSYDVADV